MGVCHRIRAGHAPSCAASTPYGMIATCHSYPWPHVTEGRNLFSEQEVGARLGRAKLLRAGIVCTALVGAALGVGLVIEHLLELPNILLIFLPVILFAAVRYGFWAGSWASVLSIVATSYFLAEPRFSFGISDAPNIWALIIFIVVSAFTSSLAAEIRERAAAADRHSRIAEELFAFSSKLASLSAATDLLGATAEQVSSMLGVKTIMLVPHSGKLRVAASSPATERLAPPDMQAATWCWEHGEPAGPGGREFAGVARYYLPFRTARGTLGVLGIERERGSDPFTPSEMRLLEALRNQVTVSLERTRLAEEMHEAQMLAATEKLRTALLTSISHDLKTPLASILGNVSSLRQYGELYDQGTRAEMLEYTETETLRLNRFVDNLLHMTRIDAGALKPNAEMVDVADLVGSALKRSERLLQGHKIHTALAASLPMLPLDFVLTEHVLVNLLDNAAKYSPPGSQITVEAEEEAEDIVLTISDEGPGISPQDLPHIFERFFRASVADHRRAGTGLGLAICRGFIEAMGGRIDAANRSDGSGAAFVIRLPKTSSTGASP
jgi:two-component system sensor histidine kinase KdpD